MEALSTLLLVFILICAVAVSLTKDLLTSIIIFMAQSTAMSRGRDHTVDVRGAQEAARNQDAGG